MRRVVQNGAEATGRRLGSPPLVKAQHVEVERCPVSAAEPPVAPGERRGGIKANLQAYSKLFQIYACFVQTISKERFGGFVVFQGVARLANGMCWFPNIPSPAAAFRPHSRRGRTTFAKRLRAGPSAFIASRRFTVKMGSRMFIADQWLLSRIFNLAYIPFFGNCFSAVSPAAQAGAFIETVYNVDRLHSALGHKPPGRVRSRPRPVTQTPNQKPKSHRHRIGRVSHKGCSPVSRFKGAVQKCHRPGIP